MPSLIFPSNPQTSDSYIAPSGQIYFYDGVKWIGGTGVVDGDRIIDNAPDSLNTLRELAAAINNDPTFSANVNTILNTKAAISDLYRFSVAADDSTQREISRGEVIKFTGAGTITTSSDAEGNITITGAATNLTGYATETYVGTQLTSKAPLASPAFTGTPTGITASHVGLGLVENTALSTSTHNIGTTSITYNRASAAQTLSGVSIDGNAGTVTNGVYTTDTGSVTNTMLAGSIANSKLTNSSITFGSTAQALGSTISGITGVTLNNGAIGGTTPAAGTFTTLTATDQIYQNNLSMLGISLIMS